MHVCVSEAYVGDCKCSYWNVKSSLLVTPNILYASPLPPPERERHKDTRPWWPRPWWSRPWWSRPEQYGIKIISDILETAIMEIIEYLSALCQTLNAKRTLKMFSDISMGSACDHTIPLNVLELRRHCTRKKCKWFVCLLQMSFIPFQRKHNFVTQTPQCKTRPDYPLVSRHVTAAVRPSQAS